MKKLVFILLLVFIAMQSASFAALENKKVEIGIPYLEMSAISFLHQDANKQVTSFTGVNWSLGITHRMYFEPVKVNEINMSWEIGTWALIIPYIGAGGDYVWDNAWYAGIGLFYIFPYPRVGVFL